MFQMKGKLKRHSNKMQFMILDWILELEKIMIYNRTLVKFE